jgi:hypothetical protein
MPSFLLTRKELEVPSFIQYGERIIRHLLGSPDDCKLFHHFHFFVKKGRFKLLDLLAGLPDVLIIEVN